MSKLGCSLLTVAFLVVVAIAIPNMLRPSCEHGNRTAAIATLRNLGSAQALFQEAKHSDLDGDGIGEFGTFGEMTKTDGIRGDSTGATRRRPMDRSVLSAALAAVQEEGVVTKSGYCFRIWLPGAKTGGVHEGRATPWRGGGWPEDPKEPAPPTLLAGSPFSGPLDVDASEVRWCAYAWPVEHDLSGDRAFFVDQAKEVWQFENKGGRYQGALGGPAWDAAMPADGRPGWSSTPELEPHIGRDGNEWKPVD